MKIYAYLFFLGVGLFMMTAAMCNKEIAKPTRPVFEVDTTGTGGGNNNNNNPGGGGGTGGGTIEQKGTLTVYVEMEVAPGTPIEDAIVSIGQTTQDTVAILAGTHPSKETGADGKVTFDGLTPGQYFIFGEYVVNDKTYDNYKTGWKTAHVVAKGTNNKEIRLKERK